MIMQKLTAVVAFLGAANAYTLTTDVVSRSAMRTSSRIYMADEPVPMTPTCVRCESHAIALPSMMR